MSILERAGAEYLPNAAAIAKPPLDLRLEPDFLAPRGLYHPETAGERQRCELLALLAQMDLALANERRAARRHPQIISVMSARDGEGKSFLAANLALVSALDRGDETLLVGAETATVELVAELIAVDDGDGLLNYESAIFAENAPLGFLGLAGVPGDKILLENKAAHAARIIIDGPSVDHAARALEFARIADIVVFIIEANKTPRHAASVALAALQQANRNVKLVLNRCHVGAGGS